jgi:hypothetical protein
MKQIIFAFVIFVSLALLPSSSYGLDASNLGQLVGYTIVASTNTTGNFEGADFDKVVKLDNGMIFEFHEYDYFYEYRPDVIVFAKAITLPSGRTFTDYKLVISDEDEVFDVTRIR